MNTSEFSKNIVIDELEFAKAPTIKSSTNKAVPLPQQWNSATTSLRDCMKATFNHYQQYNVDSNKQRLQGLYYIFPLENDRVRFQRNFLAKLESVKELDSDQMNFILKQIIESYDSVNCL